MTAFCCKTCLQSIERVDPQAGRIWLDLCASFVEFANILTLRETRVPWVIPAMRILERLGFIVTADGFDAIKIRVEGYEAIDTNEGVCLETFCIDRGVHSRDWV